MSNVIVKNILLLAMLVFGQIKADAPAIKENDQMKHMTYNFLRHYLESQENGANNFNFDEIEKGFDVRTSNNTFTHGNKQIVIKGEKVFKYIFETFFVSENPGDVLALKDIM